MMPKLWNSTTIQDRSRQLLGKWMRLEIFQESRSEGRIDGTNFGLGESANAAPAAEVERFELEDLIPRTKNSKSSKRLRKKAKKLAKAFASSQPGVEALTADNSADGGADLFESNTCGQVK